MTLLCQKNSYLKEFTEAAIKSIQPGKIQTNNGSKWITGYDVVLEDTIFFPEGGGQPYDIGTLDGIAVTNVHRDGDQAVLFIPAEDGAKVPLEVGIRPHQAINWSRRFDHMQQHSGQHLIMAIALKYFNLPTTSWCLGAESSFIEMDTKEITDQTLAQLEETVNEKIRQRIEIQVHYRDPTDLADVRFHLDMPEDQRATGVVRVVEITEGIDKNTCCGTHVTNLGDLQVIKLLGTTKGKKAKTQVHFLAGGRVLRYLGDALKREKILTVALKCPPEEFIEMVEKTQKTVKRLQKNCLNTLRDLAQFEAERYLAIPQANRPIFYSLHRREGDFDFITIFLNTVNDTELAGRLILLSVADDCLVKNSPGQIVLAGEENLVQKAAEIAINQFSAKGSIQKGKFRGRLQDLSKMVKFEEAIRATVLP